MLGNKFMFTITWWTTIMRLQFNIMIHNTMDSWTIKDNSYMMRSSVMTSLITSFMGPTWGPSGATEPRWAPCWPHELCYLGNCRLYDYGWEGMLARVWTPKKIIYTMWLPFWLTWTHMTMRNPVCVCVTNDANGYARCDDIFLSNKHRFLSW